MSEQEKKRQRIYDLLNRIQSKENFFRKRTSEGLNKKRKEGFLTALATTIKKDTTTSIRKHANELKVHEKTAMAAVKQGLGPDLTPLYYAIWRVFESKTNATSHPNFGSLKTAIEEEWNEMPEEFILKACKSFRRLVTISKKNQSHIE